MLCTRGKERDSLVGHQRYWPGPRSRDGERGRLYLTIHCLWHHRNDSCMKMGSDESPFNVSLIVRTKSQDSVHRPQLLKCRNHSRAEAEVKQSADRCKPENWPQRFYSYLRPATLDWSEAQITSTRAWRKRRSVTMWNRRGRSQTANYHNVKQKGRSQRANYHNVKQKGRSQTANYHNVKQKGRSQTANYHNVKQKRAEPESLCRISKLGSSLRSLLVWENSKHGRPLAF